MSTSRKDFVAIARAISDGQLINCASEAEVQINKATRTKIAYQIADALAAGNPRFDGAKFLKAAGVAP